MAKKIEKTDLIRLLEEMTPTYGLVDSANDPGWYAHRRAERLDEAQLFPMLCEIIEERSRKEDTELRRNAYFVLGKLLQRSMDSGYCQFFLDRLKREKDKYVIDAMLTSIGWLQMPAEVGIDAILSLSRSDKWLIRHSAIYALRSSNTEASREAIRYWVRQEDEKKYKYELSYAQAALGYIGTAEDIQLLEKHIHSRVRDVKDSAIYAIESIRQRILRE